MGNSDSLADPVKFRCLISTGCLPKRHRQGSPAFIVVWLSQLVTPVTSEVHLSVTVVCVKIDATAFHLGGHGRQLHLAVSRLHPVSHLLRPAGLLNSLIGAFVRKLNASGYPDVFLKLSGELPNSHYWTLTSKSYILHGIPPAKSNSYER